VASCQRSDHRPFGPRQTFVRTGNLHVASPADGLAPHSVSEYGAGHRLIHFSGLSGPPSQDPPLREDSVGNGVRCCEMYRVEKNAVLRRERHTHQHLGRSLEKELQVSFVGSLCSSARWTQQIGWKRQCEVRTRVFGRTPLQPIILAFGHVLNQRCHTSSSDDEVCERPVAGMSATAAGGDQRSQRTGRNHYTPTWATAFAWAKPVLLGAAILKHRVLRTARRSFDCRLIV
jgi:hypothetical protein